MKKLDTIAGAATKLLADDNAYERLNKTIENTSEMIAAMHNFVTNNLDDLEIAVKNLKIITSDLKSAIDKYEPRTDKLVGKLDLTIDETRKLVNNADHAILNANKLIDDLSVITEDIRKADGIVGRLIYDKEFADKMDSTFNTLYEFLLQIKEHGININTRLGTRP